MKLSCQCCLIVAESLFSQPCDWFCPSCAFEVDWTYMGEGNKNLVLSKGTKIFRLLKICSSGKTLQDDALQRCLPEKYSSPPDDLMTIVNYASQVMAPLLDPRFIPSMKLVRVCPNVLSQVVQSIEHLRPEKRRIKSVNFAYSYAIEMDNMAYMPSHGDHAKTVTVEIKPKSAVCPELESGPCFYCMNQHVKVSKDVVDTVSSYCPMDLFSANKEQVLRAVRNLMANPQNNFRFFVDGEVHVDDKRCGEKLFLEVEEILFSDLHDLNMNKRDLLVEAIAALVWKPVDGGHCRDDSHNGDGVLRKLLEVQRLDRLGVCAIHDIYTELEEHFSKFPRHKEVLLLAHPSQCTEWLQEEELEIACQKENIPLRIQEAARKMRNFLIARTAKDATIMLTMQKCGGEAACGDSGKCLVLSGSTAHLRWKVGIVDVDPKAYAKVPRYRDQLTRARRLASEGAAGGGYPKACHFISA